jgi:hypothetical protein
MSHINNKTSEAEPEPNSDIKQMLQDLLAASAAQQRQMNNLQKEINDIKQRASTPDYMPNDEDQDSPMENTLPQHQPMEAQFVAPALLSEANRRHFNGTKFDSATQDVLEWADYFRGYLATRTADLPKELQENVSLRMLGEALVGSIEQFWFAEIRKTSLSWKKILEELEDNFVPDHKRHLAGSIESLRECKQKENENTKIYLLRFERTVARHKRTMEKKRLLTDEMLIIQALYAGVTSYEIAKAIKGSRSWAKALAAAKLLADEDNQWRYLRADRTMETGTEPSRTEETTTAGNDRTPEAETPPADSFAKPPPTPPPTNLQETTMAELVKGMNDLRILMSKQQAAAAAPRTPGAPRARIRTSKSDIVCFNCDQKGHYSNECTQPPTKKTMLAQMELDNQYDDPEAESFVGCVYLTAEDYREYTHEQYLREQDFPQGW